MLDFDLPLSPILMPDSTEYFMLQLDVPAKVVLVAEVDKVLLDLRGICVVRLPLGIWLESVRVDVCWHVASTTRIPVLQPCATDFMILLVAHEFIVSQLPLHLVGGTETGGSSPDMDDAKLSRLRVPLLHKLESVRSRGAHIGDARHLNGDVILLVLRRRNRRIDYLHTNTNRAGHRVKIDIK